MTLVVDAHVHLGVDPAHGFRQERSELLERMGQAGIDLAIATGFPRPNRMLAVNEELAGLLGDGILGAGLIAPGAPEAPAEVDRLIDDYGMYAAVIDVESTFEYYLVHGTANSTVTATMDRLAERKLPVFIHAHHPLQRFLTADAALGVDALACRYPELPIVVNTRMPSIALTFSHPNVYVESSLDTASPVDLAHYCSLAGARRFFFASNAPVEHPKIKKMAFERAAVSEEERALMLGGSVIDVLNLLRDSEGTEDVRESQEELRTGA
jgi:predicted TIM-barrel fold metal-dependent hydrolase